MWATKVTAVPSENDITLSKQRILFGKGGCDACGANMEGSGARWGLRTEGSRGDEFCTDWGVLGLAYMRRMYPIHVNVILG